MTGLWPVSRMTLRLARVRILAWVVLMTVLTVAVARAWDSLYPTAQGRLEFSAALQASPALTSLLGPLYDPVSTGGLTAWRLGSGMVLVLGLASIFLVVKHTRADESVGRTDLPYKNIKEMVEYAKKNPGKINRGSPGAAILTNLAPMSFEKSLGISTTHIPFSGDSPAVQALLGGNIDIHGTSITGSLPHIRSGRLRVLGVMDSKRMPQVPEALTFKEQGFDLEATLWYSLSVPAATPKDVIQRLNRAVNDVIADPQFVEKAQAIGMEPRGGTPEQLAKFIQVEADRWLPVLQSLNLPKQGR